MGQLRTALAAIAAAFIVVPLNVGSAAAPQAQVRDFGDPSVVGLLIKFKPGLFPDQMQAHLAAHGFAKTRRLKAPRRVPDAAIGRWWHVTLNRGQRQSEERTSELQSRGNRVGRPVLEKK